MNKYKKLILALGLFIVAVGIFLIPQPKAHAQFQGPANRAQVEQCLGSLRFRNIAQIYCTINGLSVIFRDQNPQDSTINYKPIDNNAFCGVDGPSSIVGINITSTPNNVPIPGGTIYNTTWLRWITEGGPGTVPIRAIAKVDLDYFVSGSCRNLGTPGETVTVPVENLRLGVTMRYAWNGNQLVSLVEGTQITLSRASSYETVYHQSTACRNSNRAILLNSTGANAGKEYVISRSGPDLPNPLRTIFGNDCSYSNGWTVSIFGTRGQGSDTVTPSSNNDEEACSGDFGWAICPVITMGDNLAGALYSEVKNLLSFRVPRDVNNTEFQDIKVAWSVFRTIVSVVVVILMLVMIISQAIGRGPFEAYTIQKVLPRIAIGVILIQISWDLFAWIINLVDDIGTGLGNLMYAPFGGSSALTIEAVLGKYQLTTGAAAFSFMALIGGAIALAIALPLVLSAVFFAVISILVAFFTLIFRKILLTLCLMTAPIALMLWVLPNAGIQKYWNLWWDNFLKALLMYPLIVALIAAGQIFAWVSGSQANQLVTFMIILVGFFGPLFLLPKCFKWGGTVMQTAGNYASRAAEKGLIGKEAAPMKYFKARQQDWNEQRRRSSVQRVAGGEGFSSNPLSWYRTPLDRLRSGKYDPLKQTPGYRSIGERSVEEYVHAGEEVYQKDLAAAQAKIVRERQRVRALGGNHDAYLHAIADGKEVYTDKDIGPVQIGKRSQLERMAARKEAATLGSATNWRYLESYYQRSQDPDSDMSDAERIEARKFFDDNVSTIMPKMSHIYQGVPAAADSNPSAIGGMHGVEVESILSNLSKTIIDPSNNGRITDPRKIADEKKKAQNSLVGFLQNFKEATENENIQVDNGALKAVLAFLDSRPASAGGGAGFLNEINTHAYDGRVTRHLPELQPYDSIPVLDPTTVSRLDTIKAGLSGKIDPRTGTFRR